MTELPKFSHRLMAPLQIWLLLLGLACAAGAAAQSVVPAPPAIAARAYVLIDSSSGQSLLEQKPDERMEPASLTKLMTAYVVFAELKSGHLKLTDPVLISEKAWRMPGSRTFVEVGKQVPVETLLLGMIVQSGNDATLALAEHLAGSEEVFANLMNQRAQAIGLKNSHFTNSTGLPHPEHYTTARDLALLTRALILEFPEYYRWYSQREFTYNNITQQNRNLLLWRDASVDGVKTGHTETAGYCLVASALRDNMRLVSVVLGTKGEVTRAEESQKLLNFGFRFFETRQLYNANEALTKVRIWKGDVKELPLGLSEPLVVTIPRGQYPQLKAAVNLPPNVTAPATKGQAIGKVTVTLGQQQLLERPLVALQDVPEGGLFDRLVDEVMLMIQ